MLGNVSSIVYTKTDEAPALATHSLLPIIRAYAKTARIDIELQDISLAGRIIATFPENLTKEQRQPDALAQLGEAVKLPDANVIKLPNISASVPQLIAAIKELQGQGYNIPAYSQEPKTPEEEESKVRYSTILGSAVNPVLREGNSDRRVAAPVKEFAKANPHSMGEWSRDSKTHVASMQNGDFYSSEQSVTMKKADEVRIEIIDKQGNCMVLKDGLKLQEGEVIDGTRMSCKALRAFFEKEMQDAKKQGILLSLHMKATMMKVSDPIIFGHAVSVYYKDVFQKYGKTFDELGVNVRNGVGDLFAKIQTLPESVKTEIEKDIQEVYAKRPELAMVNSDKGITNLHVPSDVIIDASIPAAIRSSGKMWGRDGKLHDTKALIPDRNYSGVYAETIDFCRENGAFDPRTMGNVANVGLMAQKAEEYGSHNKTFEIKSVGKVRVVDSAGSVLMEHDVEGGDIWRMCQTKDAPIRDWVKLAVTRSRATGAPAIFWLDNDRAHDRNLIEKVKTYLKDHNIDGLEIAIMSPVEATRLSLQRVKDGQDTISVTGNVLRDYLTDLFPILELGTSAKMLSIVPLLAGGGLFETGAGGSAPKHVQQFVEEGFLRWDSLGELLALAVSFEDLGEKTNNNKAKILAKTLNAAISQILINDKSPERGVGGLDNRGSHFYLNLYWAQALAEQSEDEELKSKFSGLAQSLAENQSKILGELQASQGKPVDIGGYYRPIPELVTKAMRPSATMNALVDAF